MSAIHNTKILIGSIIQALNQRMVVGDTDTTMITLINSLFNSLAYARAQYNAGNTSYSTKIEYLERMIVNIRYKCPTICNYKEFGQLIDFRASNMTITVDTLNYRVSQLQIPS